MKWLLTYVLSVLAPLILTGLVYRGGVNLLEPVVSVLVEKSYEGLEVFFNYLGNVPDDDDDDDKIPSHSPYKCPEWAAISQRDPPHHKYIAWRDKDIENLNKSFHSFEHYDDVVNVVYLVGVPGSGKTELARQFGISVFCKPEGAPIVVTLNTETPDELRDSLAESIFTIEYSSHEHDGKPVEELRKIEIKDLFVRLKTALKKKPGWLLIIDNIKEPNITQKEMYQKLPKPGKGDWGTGKMLVTTQIPLVWNSDTYIRVENNTGLTLPDATNFLLKLVNNSELCDNDTAREVVIKLELLPLSILAASAYINEEIGMEPSNSQYSCRAYLAEYSRALNISHRHNHSTVEGYKDSMVTALNLTISKALEVYSDVFSNFIALVGFTAVNRKSISVKHVEEYLTAMGHASDKRYKVRKFPLVYLSEKEKVFRVHQVVSYAFRAAIEQTNTDETVQITLRSISYYFADQYKKSGEFKYDIEDHYSDLVQNLPIRFPQLDTCLIAQDLKDLETVVTLIFEAYNRGYYWAYDGFNCSKLDTFLFQLSHSPIYLKQVAVELHFKGYQALYTCHKMFNKVNGSYLAAKIAVRFIKERVPELSELHTVPVSWILLKGLDKHGEKSFYKHVTFYLLFPHYLKFSYSYDGGEIRRKICSSLFTVTHILISKHKETVRMYCNPDLNNLEVRSSMNALLPCFNGSGTLSIGIKPFMETFSIPLGRNLQLGYPMRTDNPFGGKYELDFKISGVLPGRYLSFHLDYDKRVGSKIRDIAVHKYRAILHFFVMVREMQWTRNWQDNNATCESIRSRLKAFSTKTELEMQNDIKTIMKTFYEDFSLFVDNYCESLHSFDVTKLHEIFYTWYMNVNDVHCLFHQLIEVLIDEVLKATGLQRQETKEITEMLIEIIAGTIFVATNDNFQTGLQIIQSGRPSLEVYSNLAVWDQLGTEGLSEGTDGLSEGTDGLFEKMVNSVLVFLISFILCNFIILLYFFA